MESKTYVFGDGGGSNGMLGLLAPLLQKSGLDPNLLLAMNNRSNSGFGGEGSWFIWILFMFMLWGNNGWGNNNGGGYGGGGIPNLINNDAGRELLMSAIQGNGQAINSLASTLNCSIGQVQAAINGVMTQVQSVGNQVGQSSLQIINAIQAGNNSIAAQLAECCCENRLAISQQTNTLQQSINSVAVGQERGFSNLSYSFEKSISDSTEKILQGQRAAEMRDMQDKLDRLREENSTYKTSAMTSQIVGQATAPLGAALGDLSARLAKIECKQPETVTIPYSPVVGVPNCVAAQYGFYGPFGVPGTGFFG